MFSSLKIYLFAGLFLVLAAMTWRINYLSDKADRLEAQVADLVSANQSNQQTISTQGRALAEWRSLAVTPEEAAIAVALHERLKETVLSLSEQLRKAKETDRAKPECAAWLNTDVESICPAITRGLRDAASGKDRNGRGANPGR